MLTRRQAILAIATLTGGTAAYTAGSFHRAASRYDEAVRHIWRPTTKHPPTGVLAVNRELVRYATLAASSHNTQCWKFGIEDQRISILPDWSRRCPAVDPDNHHLFVSLGCATENLIQAAQAFGKRGDVRFDSAIEDIVKVTLEPSKVVTSPLFDAIPKRQCTRSEYDGRKVSNDDLKSLESAGSGNGVHLLMLTETTKIEKVLKYVIQGNTAQMSDSPEETLRERPFVEELEAWIRFGYGEVVSKGDGLFSGSTGNPVVPRWLGMKLFNLFFTVKNENDKYAKQIRSSAGIAVFVSDRNDKEHWVETGRCYERFALQATALGIKNAFLNQPVEVSALRPQFAAALGIGVGGASSLENRRPDLVVRFGYGSETPRSLRRPLDQVIVV